MVANRKVSGTASSMPAGLALGGCMALAVTLIGSVIAGYMISEERIPESGIGYCAMGILLAASALSAAVAVKKVKRRRIYVCALSGVIYYGILLSMTALFFGGQYQGMGVTGLVILAGCGFVALLGLRGEKGPKYRKNKSRYR